MYEVLIAKHAVPLPAGHRYYPSRSVLLAAYHATHGPGCLYSRKGGGLANLDARDKAMCALWRNLIGGDVATPDAVILAEAKAALKRQSNVRTASPSHQRWLTAPPGKAAPTALPTGATGGAATLGFGSNLERLHPVEMAAKFDSTLDAPAVGVYNPEQIRSQKAVGSTWSKLPSNASKLKSGGATDGANAHRAMPWAVNPLDLTPAAFDYRTSSRDMGKQALKKAVHPSAGMAKPSSTSRLHGSPGSGGLPKAAIQGQSSHTVGPGAYDVGAFNLSRNDRSRPSPNFQSRTPRTELPFASAAGSNGSKPEPLVAHADALEARLEQNATGLDALAVYVSELNKSKQQHLDGVPLQ